MARGQVLWLDAGNMLEVNFRLSEVCVCVCVCVRARARACNECVCVRGRWGFARSMVVVVGAGTGAACRLRPDVSRRGWRGIGAGCAAAAGRRARLGSICGSEEL